MTAPASQAALGLVAPPAARRRLQTENSLAGKVYRRWKFTWHYLLARSQWKMLQRFEPIVAQCFQHEWLAGANVALRLLPGDEDREIVVPWPGDGKKYLFRLRPLPWRKQQSPAKWAAPITVTIFKHGKSSGPPETVRYMSCYLHNRVMQIVQLQGVPLIEMPKGLRDWAERFVKAAMEFARQENLSAVWIARAESLYSYEHPGLWPHLAPELRQREIQRIRDHIESHHNQTARNLDFQLDGDWFKWANPDFKC